MLGRALPIHDQLSSRPSRTIDLSFVKDEVSDLDLPGMNPTVVDSCHDVFIFEGLKMRLDSSLADEVWVGLKPFFRHGFFKNIRRVKRTISGGSTASMSNDKLKGDPLEVVFGVVGDA
ncbi:hypothetical protein BHE74_00047988 [Ensete ventricosum]|nr:hypothetical protein BHE74_00047988 [Ensete ventricosum]